VFIAIVVSLILLAATSQLFTSFTGLYVDNSLFFTPYFILLLFAILIITTLFAGMYPAFVLSSFKAISSVRESVGRSKGSAGLRSALVVFQFAITGIVLIVTLTVFGQIKFMESQRSGIDFHNVVTIKIPAGENPARMQKVETLKKELQSMPNVEKVTISNFVPGQEIDVQSGIRLPSTDPKEARTMRVYNVDDNFIDTYSLKLIHGRNFFVDTTRQAVILNRAAVKFLNIPGDETAVGRMLIFGNVMAEIVGVVDDFSQKSLKYHFDPLIISYSPESAEYYSVKVNQPEDAGRWNDFSQEMNTRFSSVFPANPFDYQVLEDSFNYSYDEERNYRNLLTAFSILTVFISVFGLFGLSAYSISRRMKELSIRKVLGGSGIGILAYFSKGSVLLVVLAQLFAVPVSYYLASKWLNAYPFRVPMSPWYFVLPFFVIVLVSTAVLTFHVYRASRVNPTKILSGS
jgi:putative ABC transport system permease protein